MWHRDFVRALVKPLACHIHTHMCTFQSFFLQIWGCFTREGLCKAPSEATKKSLVKPIANALEKHAGKPLVKALVKHLVEYLAKPLSKPW